MLLVTLIDCLTTPRKQAKNIRAIEIMSIHAFIINNRVKRRICIPYGVPNKTRLLTMTVYVVAYFSSCFGPFRVNGVCDQSDYSES